MCLLPATDGNINLYFSLGLGLDSHQWLAIFHHAGTILIMLVLQLVAGSKHIRFAALIRNAYIFFIISAIVHMQGLHKFMVTCINNVSIQGHQNKFKECQAIVLNVFRSKLSCPMGETDLDLLLAVRKCSSNLKQLATLQIQTYLGSSECACICKSEGSLRTRLPSQ